MLSRRQLFQLAVTASALALPFKIAKASDYAKRSAKSDRTKQNHPLLKPARLKPGAVVGIISPASATFIKEELNIVLDAVRGLGLMPKLGVHVRDRYGYLAGTDKDRAADINQFFSDPQVSALLPIRGGWGCSRILPYLDYEVIRQNPKIIIGFSDITALILGIN
ncbi:MAG: LD-carboxypeptidase, partial [Tatlockia sp.]|nr:LD-carboxypeptidase [Tatlockia sp.]